MDDEQLDALFAVGAQRPNDGVRAAVADLVVSARRDAAHGAGHPRRRHLAIGGVVLGGVILTAGGTVTAAQLNIPPFQSLEPGVQRIQEPIPVDYVTMAGEDKHCEAFLEYRHLTQNQIDAAGDYIDRRDWSSFGQNAYDTAVKKSSPVTSETVDQSLSEVLDQQLTKTAEEAVPGVSHDMYATGPVINGNSMTCALTGGR